MIRIISDDMVLENEKKIDRFRLEVEALIENRHLERALKVTTHAISHFSREGNLHGHATALFLKGITYRHQDDSPACIHYLAASQEIWMALGDIVKAAECLQECGGTCIQQADYAGAMTYFQRCLTLYQEAGEQHAEMVTRSNISTLYIEIGDIATALEGLLHCATYFKQQGKTRNLASTLSNIAEAYNLLGNYSEAIQYAKHSLILYRAEGDHKGIAEVLSILGTSYREQGKLEIALEHFQEAFEEAEKTGIHWTIALMLSDLGDILVRLRRFEEAHKVLETSLLLNGDQGHRFVYARELQRLGTLYTNLGFTLHNDQRALELLHQARLIAEECDSPMLLVPVYTTLADLYERMGDLVEAIHCFRLLRTTEKRLFNEESDKRIKNLQMRKQAEEAQKDAEIAQRGAEIARRGAEILHLRNVELATALREADRLRALADDRARHNQRIAETLQEAVLPTLPDRILPNLCVQTFYQATSDEAAIGGDFYDAFLLSEGKVALVVGDVIGHGLEAAISISKVRFALRAFLSQNSTREIDKALSQLNNFLFQSNTQKKNSEGNRGKGGSQSTLVALTLITIEPATGELNIVAAGMEPALLIRSGAGKTESVAHLDAGDAILGAVPDIIYTAIQARIQPGDLLAVTTDGITEAFSETRQQQFGLEGLEQSLSHALFARPLNDLADRRCPESLQYLGDIALATVQSFIGGPSRDDVCLLLAAIEEPKA